MKKLKKIPRFRSEKDERKFWQTVDSTKYVDFEKMERWVFPNLKLSSKPITIRLPESLVMQVKIRAHQQDIPYQSLLKQYILKGMGIAT